MIKYIYVLICFIIIVSITSCKDSFDLFDDFSDKTPVVITDSVFMYSQDTIAIVGHIKSKGGADIEVAGFCFDKKSNPSELKNQIAYGNVKSIFVAWVTDLDEDSTYYFTTFAANHYGSVRGNEIAFTIPTSAPPVVPCNLPDGKITDEGITYSINSVESGENSALYSSVYGIIAGAYTMSGYREYYIGFNAKPTTGVYTVDGYWFDHKEKRSVMMQVRFGSGHYTIEDGGKVYIEELGKGTDKYKVTFCNQSYKAFSIGFTCKGSFTTN